VVREVVSFADKPSNKGRGHPVESNIKFPKREKMHLPRFLRITSPRLYSCAISTDFAQPTSTLTANMIFASDRPRLDSTL
jgi:hypothetical protein